MLFFVPVVFSLLGAVCGVGLPARSPAVPGAGLGRLRLRREAAAAVAAPTASSPVAHLAVSRKHSTGEAHATDRANASQVPTFAMWYDTHMSGRGIWKWNNALAAYQRHMGPMAGQPLKVVEIGVQSGGSIQMWQAVMGPQCHVYGIDINDATTQFTDPLTTITIGDQADVGMWWHFYSAITMSPVDALIDDGGHEPHQMLVTLEQSFDHLTPGAMIAIEDIHGLHYVDSFFVQAAQYLGEKGMQGATGSVHVYPFVLIAIRAGNEARGPLHFGGPSRLVSTFEQMWPALAQTPGGHVILENPGWGPFLTLAGLTNFFKVFGDLHGSAWNDMPPGCETAETGGCTVTVTNNAMQGLVTGVHIYPNRLVVEVAGGPVVINAVRRGVTWLPY